MCLHRTCTCNDRTCIERAAPHPRFSLPATGAHHGAAPGSAPRVAAAHAAAPSDRRAEATLTRPRCRASRPPKRPPLLLPTRSAAAAPPAARAVPSTRGWAPRCHDSPRPRTACRASTRGPSPHLSERTIKGQAQKSTLGTEARSSDRPQQGARPAASVARRRRIICIHSRAHRAHARAPLGRVGQLPLRSQPSSALWRPGAVEGGARAGWRAQS
jgi:hypothetical protein